MMRPKRWYRNMTFGKAEWARRMYFARRLNQREIAERLGVRQHTVSRIVSGVTWNREATQ